MRVQPQSLVGLRSRKHIPPFDLERPCTVPQVRAILARQERSVLMAGGLDLIDRLKTGEPADRVIFLGGIDALKTIEREDATIHIGALATHADIAHSSALAAVLPDLPALWRTIANPRVRYAGTIGGNLMSGLPHYDAAPALLALAARATLSYGDGQQTVGIDALKDQHGCLLERVSIDTAPSVRLVADRSLHPVLSLYLAGRFGENGKLLQARLAIGCAYSSPVACDLPPSDARALADAGADIARAVRSSLPNPVNDGLATGQYRRRMIEVLFRRLLMRLGAVS